MQVAEKHQLAHNRPLARLFAFTGPAVLFLIIAGFFWKLTLTNQYTWLDSPDLAYQVLPWFQFQAGEWHRGRIPLWDPYHFGGQPLIGQAQPGAAYPLNWILFALPLRDGWITQSVLNWYFVFLHYLAALFCYWCCRDLGRSRLASIFGGAVFACGGFVGNTMWPQMLNGAIWAPLVFMFQLRALRGYRPVSSGALSGMFLGISWLSGHHQAPIFLTLGWGAIWGYYLLASRQFRRKRAIIPATAAAFAGMTGALQILPAIEYGRLALRWVGARTPLPWDERIPYFVHSLYSMPPLGLLGFVLPGVPNSVEPYVGLVALGLAITGLLTFAELMETRILAALAAGSTLLALGAHSLFHGVLYATVPLVEKARVPGAAIFMCNFAIACLSAYGIDRLLRSELPRAVAVLAATAACALGLCMTAGWLLRIELPDSRVPLTALTAGLSAVVLFLHRKRQLRATAAAVLCLVLSLAELAPVSTYTYKSTAAENQIKCLNKLSEQYEAVSLIRQQPWPYRIEVNSSEIPFNAGDWYGIDVIGGYLASLPASLSAIDIHSEPALNLYGVGYTIARKPTRAGQVMVFSGRDGLNVFRNEGAFPRTWTVHQAKTAPDRDAARRMMHSPSFDLRKTAFLPGNAPALESCPEPDYVRLVRRPPNGLTIEAEMACRGMVVISENFFPGWRATVDGKPAGIHPAYQALRGVVVERGRHVIEMRYRPWSVILGAALTLTGIIGACVLALLGRRRDFPPGFAGVH